MNKLAIVGAEESTRNNAPYDDPDFDIWAISNYANAPWMLRCDAIIEIHRAPIYTYHPLDHDYWHYLQTTDKVVYMLSGHSDIKGARLYPLQEIKDELLSNIRVHGEEIENFGSSLDYAIALALYQGYTEIEIYGCEMRDKQEYILQQPSFTFWVGLMAGRGVNIEMNCTEGIFDRPLYGRAMLDDLSKHVAFLSVEIQE